VSLSDAFISRFSTFLFGDLQIEKDTDLLLAVSGGLDSVVMLDLMAKVKANIAVAHCNFQLRGKDSDEDQIFVEQLAEKYGVKCHSEKFDVGFYTSTNKVSTQMAARELRYEWFEELLVKEKANWLVTAHHQDDHLETILLNLTKGTGIAGLHGIMPKRANLLRPMLCFNRSEIESYADENALQWREDSSNSSDYYQRNYIRHHVVPALKHINPSVTATMSRNSELFQQTEVLFNEAIEGWKTKICSYETEQTIVSLEPLIAHEPQKLILYEILKPFGFNYEQSVSVLALRRTKSGQTLYSNTHVALIDRLRLIITAIEDGDFQPYEELEILPDAKLNLQLSGFSIKSEIISVGDWQLDQSPNIFQADADRIKWPLTLRSWRQGDWLIPLGMRGKKKVSDLMIDAKIPLNLKRSQLVLQDQQLLVWAVGLRMADSIKVSTVTKNVLVLKVTKLL
jgi:tRNA(Ile)-lysidine synthase